MKRFAIQFPDGRFSNGAKALPVKFEKAKLWRLKNHVTAHLARWSADPYPKGTEVVEVELSRTVTSLFAVSTHMDKKAKDDAVLRAKRERTWAKRQVEQAHKSLAAAEERLRNAK